MVYTKTKDGKLLCKYYGADGTQIKPEYFKKVEGNISIAEDNNSYTITKDGKKTKYRAKDSKKGQIDQNIVKLNNQEKKLNKTKSEQGFIGKSWDWFKNTKAGQVMNLDGSAKAQKQIEEERKLLKSMRDNPNAQVDPETFEKVTGQKCTKANITKFQQGEFSSAAAKVQGYQEGQEMAVDIGADIVSGVAAVGIYTAAVAAAPFTGGASIAVGIAVAGASGAAIKTGLKAADAASGGRNYTLNDAVHDAATGAFSGVLAPITGGMGGAIGKTVATKLGIQAVKTVGKEVAEEVIETGVKQGLKQGIKTALTNPTGYEYVGGNLAKRGIAMAAEMASDGAVGGAIDNAFRTAIDGGSLSDISSSAVEGFVGGALFSPIIGGGFKAAGKAGHNLGTTFKANDISEIDLNFDGKLNSAGKKYWLNYYKNNKIEVDKILQISVDLNGKPTKRYSIADAKKIIDSQYNNSNLFNHLTKQKIEIDNKESFRFTTDEIFELIELSQNYKLSINDLLNEKLSNGTPKYTFSQIKNRIMISESAIKDAEMGIPTVAKEITKPEDLGLDDLVILHSMLSIENFSDKLAAVDDKYLLKYIQNDLNNKKYKRVEALLDAINNYKGTYNNIRAVRSNAYNRNASFAKFSKSGTNIADGIPDFNFDKKLGGIKDFIKEFPKSKKISDYLYKNYYLKSLKELNIDPAIIDKCSYIHEKYNVKIFPGVGQNLSIEDINFIDREFTLWNDTSNGKAIFPHCIDFSRADAYWFDTKAAYGDGTAAGYNNSKYGYQAYHFGSIRQSLRHELTHRNDLTIIENKKIPQKYNLELIMPKNKNAKSDTNLKFDIENAPYTNELRNAGIEDDLISYAYNNTKEFIAVAAEGDMSKYSSEFKQVLIDFGMPEWLLKLPLNK